MRGYMDWILRHRWAVIVLTVVITVLAISQARNLRIIIDPNTMLPQSHPYVATTLRVQRVFGSKYVVVIGVTPQKGDIYQPAVLERVQRITADLMQTPGVVRENLLSLSARRAKDIRGTPDGMDVEPLMERVPKTPAQLAALRAAVHRNPAYLNSIVSKDERTATILAEFRGSSGGFSHMMNVTNAILAKERTPEVRYTVGGMPVFLAHIEKYSERMRFLFPLAVLIVGLILFEAFRTFQGMVLPLVTALLAVAWGIGTMGAAGIPMDAFNATTPILILAVASGHAVQLLKRYYEEYYRILGEGNHPPAAANRLAVIEAAARSGPVMIVAGVVAALGFFSLIVFKITTVRTFGIFTGVGILAALVLEMTFTPALRSLLRPPGGMERRAEQRVRIWDRIERIIAAAVTSRRRWVYIGAAIFVVVGLFGMTRVVTNNSTKTYFAYNLPFEKQDRFLNAQMGGTNTLNVLIEGKSQDAIKDPKVLKAMDDIQHFLEQQPYVGKTVSMADFIKRMNQSMHGDDPAYYRIPDDRKLISQYLLLYSMSGEPGDFDSYVDNDYRLANMTAFIKTDSSAYIETLIAKLKPFAEKELAGSGATFHIGGSVPQAAALNDTMVHGKILNIIQIGTVVLVISSLVFRSLLAGLLVLLPLLIAVVANFGLMGYTGMYLNIANSLSSAMAVGIGADYAIYIIFRLREEISKGRDETEAVRVVLATAGKASLFVAVAISMGYGVLMFSPGFNLHFWLASLIGTSMMVSVFAASFLIPALILTFRPNFVYKGAKT